VQCAPTGTPSTQPLGLQRGQWPLVIPSTGAYHQHSRHSSRYAFCLLVRVPTGSHYEQPTEFSWFPVQAVLLELLQVRPHRAPQSSQLKPLQPPVLRIPTGSPSTAGPTGIPAGTRYGVSTGAPQYREVRPTSFVASVPQSLPSAGPTTSSPGAPTGAFWEAHPGTNWDPPTTVSPADAQPRLKCRQSCWTHWCTFTGSPTGIPTVSPTATGSCPQGIQLDHHRRLGLPTGTLQYMHPQEPTGSN
jgi:hypothetical protein